MSPRFPDPPLNGNGVVLRLPEDSDVSWIAETCADREIHRWIPLIPHPYTEADARWFVEHTKSNWMDGSHAAFVIEDSADHMPLGVITLHLSATDDGLAGVGYWLRKEGRGRGAATTALRLVSGWAFDVVGIQRLHLTTLPDNVASQRVAERAGFQREGVLRAWVPTSEGRHDSVMFSLLAADGSSARP